MTKISRILPVFVLLGLLSLAIVPASYIHALHNHTDTSDNFDFSSTTTIENNHQHCLILKIEFTVFLSSPEITSIHSEILLGTVSNSYLNPFQESHYYCITLRGPPALS